jgi:signal peptidase I
MRVCRLNRSFHLLRATKALFALSAVLLTWGCGKSTVVTSTMSPSIKPGETVRVDYTAYAVAAPKRWDVVTFEPPMLSNQVWAMRVIALPGETVSFSTGGVTLNGQSLKLPPHITNVTYVSLDDPAFHLAGSTVASPYVVPPNSYFVLGDNSKNANDSRFWGAVPAKKIIGKVRDK